MLILSVMPYAWLERRLAKRGKTLAPLWPRQSSQKQQQQQHPQQELSSRRKSSHADWVRLVPSGSWRVNAAAAAVAAAARSNSLNGRQQLRHCASASQVNVFVCHTRTPSALADLAMMAHAAGLQPTARPPPVGLTEQQQQRWAAAATATPDLLSSY